MDHHHYEYDFDSPEVAHPDSFEYCGVLITPLQINLVVCDTWNPYPEFHVVWWTCELALPPRKVTLRTSPKAMKDWAINEAKSFVDDFLSLRSE